MNYWPEIGQELYSSNHEPKNDNVHLANSTE